jgi:hypothetical protein
MNDQKQKLLNIVIQNPVLEQVLDRTTELKLPNWYIGAGVISQTYWNYAHGYKIDGHIKDIDLVYYDTNSSYGAEDSYIQAGQKLFADIPIEVEIRNQARVHIWYPKHFGRTIKPYKSAEDAISSWATTVTCIGITKRVGLQVFAPFGLDDLFDLIIRPVKKQVVSKEYKYKADRWTKIWPKLTVLPW